MIHVIAYDIADDGARVKVADRLATIGYRIQRSVFQVDAPPEAVAAVVAMVEGLIEHDKDVIHVFRICGACETHRIVHGQGSIVAPVTHWVV
jgi:CRISPR-associated protein Cas2